MSTPLIVFDVIQAQAFTTFNVQSTTTTFHYVAQLTGFAPGVSDQDCATTLDGIIAPFIKAVMGAAVTYNGMQVRIISRVPQPAAVASTAGTGVGTVGGGLLPLQTRGFWSRRTNTSGRAFRGRVYIPFPAQNDNTGGVPSGAYQTRLIALANAIEPFAGIAVTGGGGAATLVPTIFHRARPGPPPVPASETVITSRLFPIKWATQRRSGSFGRPNVSPI